MSGEQTQSVAGKPPRVANYLGAASLALGSLALVVSWGAVFANDVRPEVTAWVPANLLWSPPLASVVGILLGAIAAILCVRHSRGTLARAGIWVCVVGGFLELMLFTPIGLREFASSRKSACLMNMKDLATAMQLYLGDNDNVFPLAANWCDQMKPLTPDPRGFQCPEARGLKCAYAYNAGLSGTPSDALADAAGTVVSFESDKGWDAAGGRDLLVKEPRHFGGDDLGFADGHAAWVDRHRMLSEPSRFRWNPK